MGKTYANAITRRRRLLLGMAGICTVAITTLAAVTFNLAIAVATAVWTGSVWFAGSQYGYLVGRGDALIVSTRNQHRRLNGH